MCPACLTTVSLIAAGAGSAGGLATLLVRTLRAKPAPKESGAQRDLSDAPDTTTERRER
jgi:hypothetical protein